MSSSSQTASFTTSLKRLIAAKCTLIQIETFEEERAERLLGEVASGLFARPVPIMRWTCTEGLRDADGMVPKTRDPMAALDCVATARDMAIFLFEDLHPHLRDNPQLVRRLRDLARHCASSYVTIILIGPHGNLPDDLYRDVSVVEFPLPEEAELATVFKNVLKESSRTAGLADSLTADLRTTVSRAALGLTERQAAEAFRKSLAGKNSLEEGFVRSVIDEKRQLVRKATALDFIEVLPALDDVGGFENFKSWLQKRKPAEGNQIQKHDIAPPKGVLFTGVSGCGKSFCAKAIASYWKLPLLRFNMSDLYLGEEGLTPEKAMRQTIRIAETVSPCVLWIDEIEAGVSINTQKAGMGSASRVFASFLNWMQEKRHFVFVAATANVIELLPPEMLRKGRFDEIFFVGLPDQDEREEIFRIHIAKAGQEPDSFDIKALAKTAGGFNGAEIAQVVTSAMIEARHAERPLNKNDLIVSVGSIVPLSVTMREEIGRMERWAHSRATMASAPRSISTRR